MTNATKVTVSTFGALAGFAGLEHGLGEALQGNIAPNGMVIRSWGDNDLFAILGGEPAMTRVPNFLVTGILAILVSLFFLVWVTKYVDKDYGGHILILLSVILLLVGGGFGPPLLGVILGIVATRINVPVYWGRGQRSRDALRLLEALWPWSYAAGLAAWLFLLPGTIVLDYFVSLNDPDAVAAIASLTAFAVLALTIFSAMAYDIHQPTQLKEATSSEDKETGTLTNDAKDSQLISRARP